jgi:hypothetical protein
MKRVAGLLAALALAAPAPAAPFNVAPWLADLEQARGAFHEKYANWDWLQTEREVKVDALFDSLAARMRRARTQTQAMAVFNRLVQRVGDGHVEIDWPQPLSLPAAASVAPQPPDLCTKIGYDAHQNGPGTAYALPGYAALPSAQNPFDAGTVAVGDAKVGVLRIGVFQPQGYPQLCREAVRALAIPADKPCHEGCQDKILTLAYRNLTEGLERRVRQLKAAGATIVLVDISNNGGGSEWAEAAARIFSSKELMSERRGFVRGQHWAMQWRELGETLRQSAKTASPEDKQELLGWAAQADAALAVAQAPCAETSAACDRLGAAGFSTGLVGAAHAGTFAGKDWGVDVFSPAQFPYHDGVWDGPLILLIDQETWSAAEEFAAVLQDNRAALVIGARSGGAGCGHTNGGTPTTLKNSGAVLELPDCVRFRADGSNEVRGIIPDITIPIRAGDGAQFSAGLIANALPAAVAAARALQASAR